MTRRYQDNNGMSGNRLAEYKVRLQAIIDYLNATPCEEQLQDHRLGAKLGVTVGSIDRARYMIEHNCSAEHAIDSIGLKSTEARPDHNTWRNELSCGQASIDLLTRSWSAA